MYLGRFDEKQTPLGDLNAFCETISAAKGIPQENIIYLDKVFADFARGIRGEQNFETVSSVMVLRRGEKPSIS